ncbi:MAG: DNA polymerase/3'-5' exonuclease PolX [Gammaproteobacteria bacterium]
MVRRIANAEISERFERLADLLELQGDNPFRVRAYRNAARVIAGQTRPLADRVAANDDLEALPGIGEAIAEKIRTIVATGKLPALEAAAKKTPLVLTDLLRIPGLGPKRVKELHDTLGVKSAADIKRAAENGRLAELPGFGETMAQKIAAATGNLAGEQARFLLADAESLAAPLIEYLQDIVGVRRVVVAGSLRRRRETVGDLDVLVTGRDGKKILETLAKFEGVRDVVSLGGTRATVHLAMDLQVDVRVVPEVSFGAAFYYFTGSKAHNVAVRRIAQEKKLKLNEYGLYRGKKRVAGKTESEIAKALGFAWIPPELREDSGEIEAAFEGKLPKLIEIADLRGDLHSHTTASDGHDSLEDMAKAARERGYKYLAVTDHTRSTRVANGLDAKRLRRELDKIDRLNEGFEGFRLLKSAETDILEDGSLDLPDEVLRELDFVLGTIHAHFDLGEAKQTRRILRAFDNPLFAGLAHPTARHIGKREPIRFDVDKVFAAAAERDIFLEVNGQPARLDLNGTLCRHAKEMGVGLAISSDSHSTNGLAKIRYAVDQARRGWIEAKDVINTRPLESFLKLLRNG